MKTLDWDFCELWYSNHFVKMHHRHSIPVQGHKFSLKAFRVTDDIFKETLGVVIVGRPVARNIDHEKVWEVTRVCVVPDAPKGTNSFLYALAARYARHQDGVEKLITYTLKSESGASLRGAGWKIEGEVQPHYGGWLNRPGRTPQKVDALAKWRWGKLL